MSRYFEDVAENATLPALCKGPLGTAHLMRWSAAIEAWHKIHYDRPFAVDHDGLPGLLVNGSLKQQYVLRLLKDWAGPGGWVWKVSCQFRAMNQVGETLKIWGRVAGKRRAADFGLVDIEFGVLNDDDKESTPGTAIVALPYRGGKPVPYPFEPPA